MITEIEGLLELLIWVGIQVAILVYIVIGLHMTRLGLQYLTARDGDAFDVGREKFRSQAWRLTAVVGYLAIGVLVALRIKGLMIPLAVALLYGEAVLLRNQRNDVRQVRRMAAHELDEDDDHDHVF